jgi:2-dehydropantoate 2-reductase
VFGAGAIGSHVAARFAKGGKAEVSVVAREAQLEAIRARGLTVETPEERFTLPVRAESDPAALGVQDAVIVTVKAPAIPAVAAALAPLLGPETPVVFVVNGIPWWWDGRLTALDPGGVIRASVAPARVVGGVVWSACTVTEPGVVRVQTAANRVIFGEMDGAITPRLTALAEALEAGGMGGVAAPDIRTQIWTKLLNNLTNGPICLLTRRDMKSTFADPVVLAAAKAVMHEGLAIAAALGHPIPGDPEKQVLRSVTLAHKPSILQDLELGRAMEIDALFTVPLGMARQAEVPMPVFGLTARLATQAARAAGLYGA